MSDDQIVSLLEYAAELHANYTGSSDSYADWCLGSAGRDLALNTIRDRLAAWKPSSPKWKAYDDAVRAVLEAAVDEWRESA